MMYNTANIWWLMISTIKHQHYTDDSCRKWYSLPFRSFTQLTEISSPILRWHTDVGFSFLIL